MNQRTLRVTANRRYLAWSDGTPFFYLADTAWELFHRLDLDEADRYLTNRAAKSFTVVQAVALAELGGLTVPNANGHLPLLDGDPTRPNEPYWQHVDRIVSRAGELGLVVGLLPSWGSHWPVFDCRTAFEYGLFLGRRYAQAAVIWIMGGDRTIRQPAERAMLDAMANGLGQGDGGTHRFTFHPCGPGQSSLQVHDAAWLDFHMSQSSHAARDHDNGLFIAHDLALDPPRPALDGEPRYEQIPIGFYWRDWNRQDRFDDADARQAAWWAVMAGACGHTYGNNNVWQMWAPGREPRLGANVPWWEALDHPGAYQMGHLRRLLERMPFTRLTPGDAFLVDAPRSGGSKARGIAADDGSFALVYTPHGAPVTVDRDTIAGDRVDEAWFDPRYGTLYPLHTGDAASLQTYAPPSSGRGHDWVLVLTAAG